jgi:acetoin utilization deacetylase AcuC-like enzyme
VEHIVLPAARAFDPDLVLVSAGYDAHRDDPLAACSLETGSYGQLALLVGTLGKPVGYVLEGGYNLGALAASVAASMESLTSGGDPASFARGPLVERAAVVVGRHWALG